MKIAQAFSFSITSLALCASAWAQSSPERWLLPNGELGLSRQPLSVRLSPSVLPNTVPDYGMQAYLYKGSASPFSNLNGQADATASRLVPEAFINYSLVPQRLGLQSAVRLGTGRDARGVTVDMRLTSKFALTEKTHLGLSASASWLNTSASHDFMGQMVGSAAAYTLAPPSGGLMAVRGSLTLTGPLYEQWSYALGAHLGRSFGDARSVGLLRSAGNETVGQVFLRANYAF